VATAAGARVYERFNTSKKSKGFALEEVLAMVFSDKEFEHIQATLIIDADTSIGPQILRLFAKQIENGTDFSQAYYSVRNSDQSWRTRLLTYALALFNGCYLLGLDTLRLGAHLRGNGMMFTRKGLLRVPWKAASLAEDLEFSWILRLAGEEVRFLKQGIVFADMPAGAAASKSQRARWEHGRSSLRHMYTGKILKSPVSILRRAAWIIDLWMPPLSVLAAWTAIVTCVALVNQDDSLLALATKAMAIGSLCGLGCYLFSPFFIMKLPLRYLWTLCVAPYYAAWRLLVMLGKKPTAWVRTERESPEAKP
jgi:cellulose synthase/poly-beta-1,6-N-acetylglucosamine synthase-like glycosyltransferase